MKKISWKLLFNKKYWSMIFILIFGLLLAYSIETGQWRRGIWFFIGWSIIFAAMRIALGWRQFLAVVDLGANQLYAMKKVREQEKNNGDDKNGKGKE